jgi:hypothetical protein
VPRIAYVERNFRPASVELIKAADRILRANYAAGDVFTLRQLY